MAQAQHMISERTAHLGGGGRPRVSAASEVVTCRRHRSGCTIVPPPVTRLCGDRSALVEVDHVVDGDFERVGNLHEATEADAEVVGRFVPLDHLLLHADPLDELTLGEAACDARLDERCRQLYDAGRLNQGNVVESVVLSQLGLEVAVRAAEGAEP